jgi:hypothetical protein
MIKKLNKTQIEFARNQLFKKKRSVAEATPCMSVMALDREDVSWVHNQYSSLKLIYHKK